MEIIKKLLLVDDDAFFSNQYAKGLEKAGFKVEIESNGILALGKTIREQPALVILDIILPGLSGFEILTKLKQEEKTKDIPVIVLSHLNQDEDIDYVLKLGAIDFVAKSNSDITGLVEKVKTYIT